MRKGELKKQKRAERRRSAKSAAKQWQNARRQRQSDRDKKMRREQAQMTAMLERIRKDTHVVQ